MAGVVPRRRADEITTQPFHYHVSKFYSLKNKELKYNVWLVLQSSDISGHTFNTINCKTRQSSPQSLTVKKKINSEGKLWFPWCPMDLADH